MKRKNKASRNKEDEGVHFKLTYIIEKSSGVIYNLITGQGDARRRLKENEMNLKYALIFEVPDHLKKLRKRIIAKLGKYSELKTMRNVTASKIIAQFYHLFNEVKAYKEEMNQEIKRNYRKQLFHINRNN
jgi:hypothetical protein